MSAQAVAFIGGLLTAVIVVAAIVGPIALGVLRGRRKR